MEKQTVLFICSFNSVRSQLAEGLLRARCGDRFDVFSAGIAPAGTNRNTVQVMQEIGIDISKQHAKPLSLYSGKKFDYVVTLCDRVMLAASNQIPKGTHAYHRGFVSPSEIKKDKNELMVEFRALRDNIGGWLQEIFPDCPGMQATK